MNHNNFRELCSLIITYQFQNTALGSWIANPHVKKALWLPFRQNLGTDIWLCTVLSDCPSPTHPFVIRGHHLYIIRLNPQTHINTQQILQGSLTLLLWVKGLGRQTTDPVHWPSFYSPPPTVWKHSPPKKYYMILVWHGPIRQFVTICSHRKIDNKIKNGQIGLVNASCTKQAICAPLRWTNSSHMRSQTPGQWQWSRC